MLKVGLCGFTMAAEEYYGRYPVVEVQQTFYRPPQLTTLGRWRHQAPAGFEFTLKAWQMITHDADSPTYRRLGRALERHEQEQCGSFRDTPVVREAWKVTHASAAALGATRVLLQCPARFRPTDDNVNRLRALLGGGGIDRAGLTLMWEPRGAWPPSLVAELCRDLGLVHVVDPFLTETMTPDSVYFRLHGIGGSRYSYSREDLARLATRVPRRGTPYVLFNNLPRVGDADRFRALLRPC